MDQNETTTNSADAAATVAQPGFDIDSVEDIDATEIQLKRNGTPMPLFITVAGPEHSIRRNHALAKARKFRKALMANKQSAGDPSEDIDEEDALVSRCIFSWRGFIKAGVTLPCTQATILGVLRDPKRQWLRKSILEAMNDAEAFIKVSVAG